LPTSNGVVRIDATAPDVAPAMKLSMKVSLWFSRLWDLLLARLLDPSTDRSCPRPRSLASVRRLLMLSYPHQYIPENGTSLHRVKVRPRQSEVYPDTDTISPMPFTVSAKWPPPVDRLACILVLNISIGLTTPAANVLATVPATNGA
jgi:hypothetical protein